MLFVARIRGKSCVERRTINFLWDWLVLSVEKIEGRSGLTTTKGVARTVNILESVVRIIQNVGLSKRSYCLEPTDNLSISTISSFSTLDTRYSTGWRKSPFFRKTFKAWANQDGNTLLGWYRPHQQVPWLRWSCRTPTQANYCLVATQCHLKMRKRMGSRHNKNKLAKRWHGLCLDDCRQCQNNC